MSRSGWQKPAEKKKKETYIMNNDLFLKYVSKKILMNNINHHKYKKTYLFAKILTGTM